MYRNIQRIIKTLRGIENYRERWIIGYIKRERKERKRNIQGKKYSEREL